MMKPKNTNMKIDIYYGGINSDKIYIGKPIIHHKDNVKKQMFPNEARLKNLNYCSQIFCDIDIVIRTEDKDKDDKNLKSIGAKSIIEESIYSINLNYNEKKNLKKNEIRTFEHICMGSIPIMLHSKLCVLYNNTTEVLKNMGDM